MAPLHGNVSYSNGDGQSRLISDNRRKLLSAMSGFAERREFERFSLMLDASVTFAGEYYDVVLIDISAGGAKFQFKMIPPSLPDSNAEVAIEVPPHGGFYGNIVWVDGNYAGIKFDENHKAAASLIHDMAAMYAERSGNH